MKRLLSIFAFMFLCASAHGACTVAGSTYTAASASSADVSDCFALISTDGVTLIIPSGTGTWTSAISPPCHSLTLQGAGSGNTHIIANLPTGNGHDAILVSGCSGKQLRFTGIDWQYESADAFGILMFTGGTGLSVRIDHSTCEPYPSNPGYGRFFTFSVPVISPGAIADHNTVTDCGSIVEVSQSGETNHGDIAWTQSMPFETVNAFYYEDNDWSNPSYATHQVDISDCDAGGAYVMRFNTISKAVIGNHGYDSVANGCRMENAYQNTIDPQGVSCWGIQYRGGTGVDWSNIWKSNASCENFGVTTYRMVYPPQDILSQNQPVCGYSNPKDGNGTDGWPCYEQIGRGSGASAGLTSQPLYEWDNCKTALGCTGTGNQVVIQVYTICSGCTTDYTMTDIAQNRDFYDSVSSFGGTSGVGIGTLASRPTTCTTGVGYWATDQGGWNQSGSGGQGELFLCTSMNTWTLSYTPYTYPHPLQGSSYSITVSSPSNGSVADSQSLISCPSTCSTSSATGTDTLTATPSGGYTYGVWGGGTCSGSDATPCSVTTTATVTATFTANPAVTALAPQMMAKIRK